MAGRWRTVAGSGPKIELGFRARVIRRTFKETDLIAQRLAVAKLMESNYSRSNILSAGVNHSCLQERRKKDRLDHGSYGVLVLISHPTHVRDWPVPVSCTVEAPRVYTPAKNTFFEDFSACPMYVRTYTAIKLGTKRHRYDWVPLKYRIYRKASEGKVLSRLPVMKVETQPMLPQGKGGRSGFGRWKWDYNDHSQNAPKVTAGMVELSNSVMLF